MDLAKEVTCRQTYAWDETRGALGSGYGKRDERRSFTSSRSITAPSATSCAAWPSTGCRVTVVPATATAEDILRHKPDGVFLSNGPGDPAATGAVCRAGAAAS